MCGLAEVLQLSGSSLPQSAMASALKIMSNHRPSWPQRFWAVAKSGWLGVGCPNRPKSCAPKIDPVNGKKRNA